MAGSGTLVTVQVEQGVGAVFWAVAITGRNPSIATRRQVERSRDIETPRIQARRRAAHPRSGAALMQSLSRAAIAESLGKTAAFIRRTSVVVTLFFQSASRAPSCRDNSTNYHIHESV